jgi:hypothetical protein
MLLLSAGCKSPTGDSRLKDLEAGDGLTDPSTVAVCSGQLSSFPEPLLNYGVLEVDQGSLSAPTLDILKVPTDAAKSLDLIGSLFTTNCDQAKVKDRLAKGMGGKPVDIYLYFAGYGGEYQPNNTSSDHNIIKWLNQRDPNSLVIAIGWNCAAAEASGHDFCGKRATVLNKSSSDEPIFKLLSQTTGAFFSGGNDQAAGQAIQQQSAQNGGYNRSLGYALEAGIRLIDHLLMASKAGSIGKIHSVGYSGGAHMVADILREDLAADGALPKDGNKGIKWAADGVCADGSSQCKLSGVKQYGWSLAFGLSGWSHAMQTYNGIDRKGDPSAEAAKRRVNYKNGGWIVAPHADYANKLRIVNRRMDPTSSADDQLQRGFNDILLSDYNHVSHDYSLPLLQHKTVMQALDAWLDADRPRTNLELGVIVDAAADVNFDECAGATCRPSQQYLAHRINRSHQFMHIFQSPADVKITDGIETPGSKTSKAVDLRDSSSVPLDLYTFDQEDLRGGVEFWFRPQAVTGKKSLFSYSQCGKGSEELKPRAWIDGNKVVFENYYRDEPTGAVKAYTAQATLRGTDFKAGKWMHLAFSWELPVVPMKETGNPNELEGVLENKALHAAKGSQPAFKANNPILAFPAGMKNNQHSTYLYQKGAGKLRIHVNGKQAAVADFGTVNSRRECLFAKDVVSNTTYFQGYPPYIPYNKFDASTEMVALNQQIQGQICKAFKVPNEKVSFGCALDSDVTAGGDMDIVRIIFGTGRSEFGDVYAKGTVAPWTLGRRYDSKRRQRPN